MKSVIAHQKHNMKKIAQLFTALVFLSLSIFISCGGDGTDPEPDPREIQGALMNISALAPSTVTVDNGAREEWSDAGFTLTASYNADTNQGTFSASGIPDTDGATDVWPASSTWTFGGTDEEPDVSTIIRSDGIEMTVSVSETVLTLNFEIEPAGGRTFDGQWQFGFTK